MSKKKLLTISAIFVFVVCALVVGVYLLKQSVLDSTDVAKCSVDSDCNLFGETGDCNCGCYLDSDLPENSGGKCLCQAPSDCTCLNGKCEGIFEIQTEINDFEDCIAAGNPVMESYPPQCRTQDGRMFTATIDDVCNGMGLEEAKEIATASECGDSFKETYMCNDSSKTWWLDLDLEKEGCNPACVIFTETGEAEINWRCTGLIVPEI